MELLHTPTERVERMIAFLKILVQGTTDKQTYFEYADVLETATAHEVNQAIDSVLQGDVDVEIYAAGIARFIRSVGKSLEKEPSLVYPQGSLFHSLSKENEQIAQYCNALQSMSRALKEGKEAVDISAIKKSVAEFSLVKQHYIRLQNELFPLFEKASEQHNCLKLMWTLQDFALQHQKYVVQFKGFDLASFYKVFSQFFFTVEMLRYRETYILFPVAYRAFGQNKQKSNQSLKSAFACETGSLSQEELMQIFSVLPLDIAFIGSDDRVKFYSDPPHRIFPRSPQVIGRLVQNCHPPKSVATVEAILSSFKEGSKDWEEFYLTVGKSFVHIQYYALRSTDGKYLGTLEVTQDATHLRSLEGEKRLLQ